MSVAVNLVPFDQMMRDMFSANPPKWVIDAKAERAELERTGKRVAVASHLDNTGAECRNVGPGSLVADMLTHDCCYACNESGEEPR